MAESNEVILVADEDLGFAETIAASLKDRGFRVIATANGLQAGGILDTEKIVGAIVGMRLQGMSGLALLGRPRKGKYPIVLVAENADQEVLQRAVRMGVAQLLLKPISPEQVATKLGDAIDESRKETRGTYDARLINVYVSALKETLTFHFGKAPTLGKAEMKRGTPPKVTYSSLMSFNGDKIRGSIALGCESAFLLAVAQKIFGAQMQAADLTEQMATDLAGELCNQLSGAAKIGLAALGLKMMISLPKVVSGAGHKVHHLVDNPVILIPAAIDDVRCYLEFCMSRVAKEDIVETGPAEGDAKGGDVLLF